MRNVSKAGYWVMAVLMAALLLGLQVGIDRLENHYGVHGAAAYLDEALVALMCSVLVMYLIRRRRVERERHLDAIRAMNHHVRNALQSILYADHLDGADRQQKYVAESVSRIERAMWEVSNGLDAREQAEQNRLAAN